MTRPPHNGRVLAWLPILLTLIIMILGGGVSYGVISSSLEEHERRIAGIEREQQELLPEILHRLTRIETILENKLK